MLHALRIERVCRLRVGRACLTYLLRVCTPGLVAGLPGGRVGRACRSRVCVVYMCAWCTDVFHLIISPKYWFFD